MFYPIKKAGYVMTTLEKKGWNHVCATGSADAIHEWTTFRPALSAATYDEGVETAIKNLNASGLPFLLSRANPNSTFTRLAVLAASGDEPLIAAIIYRAGPSPSELTAGDIDCMYYAWEAFQRYVRIECIKWWKQTLVWCANDFGCAQHCLLRQREHMSKGRIDRQVCCFGWYAVFMRLSKLPYYTDYGVVPGIEVRDRACEAVIYSYLSQRDRDRCLAAVRADEPDVPVFQLKTYLLLIDAGVSLVALSQFFARCCRVLEDLTPLASILYRRADLRLPKHIEALLADCEDPEDPVIVGLKSVVEAAKLKVAVGLQKQWRSRQ